MPYALVTGASGGIGLELARELARKNYNLLLVSRDEKKLSLLKSEIEKEHNVQVSIYATDLSLPKSSSQVISWATAFDVEVLVNNAGFGIWGEVENNEEKEIDALVQLNLLTLTELCKGFIPLFKKRASKSYILNVASTAAYQAVPLLAVYSASKAFVVSFTRALHWEMKNTSISVSCLSPGTTSTGFMNRAKMNDALKKKAEKVTMNPDEVAKAGIKGMLAGKMEIIPGFLNQISVLLVRFVPKSLTEKIAFNLYKG